MARQINGHVGNFITSAELTSKYPPSEYMGCSANVGTSPPYIKYWCDGQTWAGLNAQALQSLVSVYGIAVVEVTPYVQRTATGIVFSGPCEYAGYDVVAVTSTPTITIYDGTDTSGALILPATLLTVGRFERTFKLSLSTGCYVVISGTATVNVLAG